MPPVSHFVDIVLFGSGTVLNLCNVKYSCNHVMDRRCLFYYECCEHLLSGMDYWAQKHSGSHIRLSTERTGVQIFLR